ncbi:MAG: hypothetical protein H6589_05645 [Flavobacteriales bacterium]|nr:hypothetical protein [Flavobacteriales bacterium]
MSNVNSYYKNNSIDDKDTSLEQTTESYNSEEYVKVKTEKVKAPEVIFDRFRINAEFGSGHLVADIDPSAPQEVKTYYEQLKTGTHYSFGGIYFPKKSYGIGAKFSSFYTKNQMQITVFDFYGNIINGTMKDEISIRYFGAFVAARSLARNKISGFYFELGFGKTIYENKAMFIDNYTINGDKIGIDFTIDYDIKVANSLAIGLGLNYNIAVLDNITVNGRKYVLSGNEKENISRLNFIVGLRYLIP